MELLLREAAEKSPIRRTNCDSPSLYRTTDGAANIWLEQVEGQQLRDAIEEYGNAIRQLAAANIFPGYVI
ncbi:hypothetical protein DMI70_01785 [Escherichia coli]|nr:hypothetical protein [Escherichia coli]